MSEDPAEYMPEESSAHRMTLANALQDLMDVCSALTEDGLIPLVATATADRSANPVIKIAAPLAGAAIRGICGVKREDHETITYAARVKSVQVEWNETRVWP